MFAVRIVKSNKRFYIEYKWVGSFLTGILQEKPLRWLLYSGMESASLKEARENAKIAAHRLNDVYDPGDRQIVV